MSAELQDLEATAALISSRLLYPIFESLPRIQGYRAALLGTWGVGTK